MNAPAATDPAAIVRTPITEPSAWTRADIERDGSWLHTLSPRALAEIDEAIEGLRRNGRTLETVSRRDFSFPTFGVFLKRFLWHDIARRGFGVIRGLSTQRYTPQELGMLFWGIGTHMGVGVSQNGKGDRLGHVRDQGLDYDTLNVRGYQTTAHLPFHCDPSDVVGLMCVRTAREGGLSSVVSGTAIYNVILQERPHYLPMLYRGFEYDRRGEETEYQKSISDPVPVFAHIDGELSIRYVRKSMETARQKLGRPFSAEELEVLDYLDSLTVRDDLRLSMMLQAGDMQFANNYTVLHSRTDYVDHEDPAEKRHMLRLWLKVPGFRRLDPAFIEYDPASGWSRREGILPRTAPMPRTIEDPLFV